MTDTATAPASPLNTTARTVLRERAEQLEEWAGVQRDNQARHQRHADSAAVEAERCEAEARDLRAVLAADPHLQPATVIVNQVLERPDGAAVPAAGDGFVVPDAVPGA